MSKQRFALLIAIALCVGASAGAYKPQCKDSSGRLIVCTGTLDNTQAPTAIAASSLTGTVAQANGGFGVDASALTNGVVVKSGGVMSTTTAPTMSGANISGTSIEVGSLAFSATRRMLPDTSVALANVMISGDGDSWENTASAPPNWLMTSGVTKSQWLNSLTGITIDAATNSLSNVGTSMLASGFNLAANQGGTGYTSYTVGDVLAANTTSTLSKVAAGTSGHVWTSNGAGVLPSYQAPVTATNSCASMSAASYALTTSYKNIGLSLSLGAGTWLVTANVRTQIQATAGTLNASLRLYNSTAGSAIANSDRFTSYSTGMLEGQTTPITEIITLESTSTIDVQGLKSAGMFTSATVNSDSSGYSRLCAVKISS